MQIDEMILRRNPMNARTFVLHCESMGFKYTGEFADMQGFLLAVGEMAQFFAIKSGKMKSKDQTTTRPILNS